MISNPVVRDKITCYYWHISCVACRSVCNGQSEMSVEPLNGGGGNIGWGAVWGESNSKSALSICLAWNQILLQKVAPLANLAFSPPLQLLHLSWFCTLLTLVFGRCRFCVLLQGDRVKVEEGLQISVVGHCCLFWKCFSICGSIRVSSSFLPSPVRSTWGSPRISTICATLAYTSPGIHKS